MHVAIGRFESTHPHFCDAMLPRYGGTMRYGLIPPCSPPDVAVDFQPKTRQQTCKFKRTAVGQADALGSKCYGAGRALREFPRTCIARRSCAATTHWVMELHRIARGDRGARRCGHGLRVSRHVSANIVKLKQTRRYQSILREK